MPTQAMTPRNLPGTPPRSCLDAAEMPTMLLALEDYKNLPYDDRALLGKPWRTSCPPSINTERWPLVPTAEPRLGTCCSNHVMRVLAVR